MVSICFTCLYNSWSYCKAVEKNTPPAHFYILGIFTVHFLTLQATNVDMQRSADQLKYEILFSS